MQTIRIGIFFLFTYLLLVTNGQGQLSVSSLIEYQSGGLPDDPVKNASGTYTNLHLTYDYENFVVGLRGEKFLSSEKEREYQHFSQRYIEWQNGPFNIRLGNSYTTFGRGLLLRGFELPNVIFEQRSLRRRYAYYRDFDGVRVQGQWNAFEFIALYGEPLDTEFPPELENIDRRPTGVEGVQVNIRPVSWWNIGNAYLRHSIDQSTKQEMNSVFTQFRLKKVLSRLGIRKASANLYVEHARINAVLDDFFSHEFSDPHATFIALNFSTRRVGFTAEFKEYRHFETGINLPPIGFKEHSYYLLNRSTHELLTDNEKGYQLELSVRPIDRVFIVAHRSQANNDYPFLNYKFFDNFVETSIGLRENLTGALFYDQARDDIKSVKDQRTAGIELEWGFYKDYGLTLELQQQKVERDFGGDFKETFNNSYNTLTFSKASLMSLALVMESSGDPGEIDDPATPEMETDTEFWFNLVAAYEINLNHQLSLFAGSRRGGLACVSGTCYEVLPFEGVELRWIARF